MGITRMLPSPLQLSFCLLRRLPGYFFQVHVELTAESMRAGSDPLGCKASGTAERCTIAMSASFNMPQLASAANDCASMQRRAIVALASRQLGLICPTLHPPENDNWLAQGVPSSLQAIPFDAITMPPEPHCSRNVFYTFFT